VRFCDSVHCRCWCVRRSYCLLLFYISVCTGEVCTALSGVSGLQWNCVRSAFSYCHVSIGTHAIPSLYLRMPWHFLSPSLVLRAIQYTETMWTVAVITNPFKDNFEFVRMTEGGWSNTEFVELKWRDWEIDGWIGRLKEGWTDRISERGLIDLMIEGRTT
jgi:hypothetical protein